MPASPLVPDRLCLAILTITKAPITGARPRGTLVLGRILAKLTAVVLVVADRGGSDEVEVLPGGVRLKFGLTPLGSTAYADGKYRKGKTLQNSLDPKYFQIVPNYI